jgi:hypothetical protein
MGKAREERQRESGVHVCVSVGGGRSTDLGENVVIAYAADDAEANQEDLSVGIAEGSQTVVLFLT